MIKSEYYVIGVMSGTSLDGIDLSYVRLKYDYKWTFEIIKSETISYSDNWRKILKDLANNSKQELIAIDREYTLLLANTIKSFIENNNIDKVDAICSHGHTALHEPAKNLTYQIGNQKNLAKLISNTVICDFRVQDVQLGGQGAPLVPIGDKYLFSDYEFCLNLGGFANISTENNQDRIAYDICPVNIVLNHYVSKMGFDFDEDGRIASSGEVCHDLLQELNSLDYYTQKPPKSLGIEWVRAKIFPLINMYNLSIENILRTFVEHIALQIASQINHQSQAKVLITGGGAYNLFLIERIKQHTQNLIVIPKRDIVEFKEALIFGLLGVLRLRNENNCLSSVTGAKNDHCSGFIYKP